MLIRRCAILTVVLVAVASVAHADIIGWDCADDGDGAIDCVASFDYGTYELSIVGDQNWGPGHMLGSFTTDTALDPTVMMYNTIDNDTGFTWTGYQVNVSMDSTFTLSNAMVFTPGDWTTAITQPTWTGSEYRGVVDYSSGTPVADTETLTFAYNLSFDGATSFQFCQEMVPTPEPTTLALLLIGGGEPDPDSAQACLVDLAISVAGLHAIRTNQRAVQWAARCYALTPQSPRGSIASGPTRPARRSCTAARAGPGRPCVIGKASRRYWGRRSRSRPGHGGQPRNWRPW